MIKNGHAYTLRKEYPHWRTWNPDDDPEKIVDGDLFSDLSEEERELIEEWVSSNFVPAATYKCASSHNSYWWKHRFEQLIGRYVSNNQAKDAFLSWGFEPEDENTLNWKFKIKAANRTFRTYDSNFCRENIRQFKKDRAGLWKKN